MLALALAATLAGPLVTASRALGAGRAGSVSITVTAGKPSEYAFTLSKQTIAAGAVTFKVVNGGKVTHAFTIAGKKTRPLAPGRTATLTVVFSKAGSYAYASPLAGQAAHGMKGVLVVAKAAVPGKASAATTTTTPVAVATPVSEPCASPAATTVNVAIFDFGFTLSKQVVPCGPVTFVVVNTGQVFHNFDVEAPLANGRQTWTGAQILPGNETVTVTVNFTRTGLYKFQCDLHWVQGQMIGALPVTQS